jgi:hypothetical protein
MELTQITEGPIGLGTRIRRRNRHLDHPVEGEMEIVEWTPGEVMGARIHDANMDTEGGRHLRATRPDRTRLTIEADFPRLDEATADCIRPLMERSAGNIRDLIESDT